MEHFTEDGEYLTKNLIQVKKFISKKSSTSVYFCNIDSQIITGYFSFGTDQPESSGIETLLWQLDSSGGLLPRQLRTDMLKPAWQFHGTENPLTDRDQSCYVCSALGEIGFLGTFSCCIYLLQNIEAVLELHGYRNSQNPDQNEGESSAASGDSDTTADLNNNANKLEKLTLEETAGGDTGEPKINCKEYYCLSEAGEGAMAWEATLQSIFPGTNAFWNRLLFEGKNKLSSKMRSCFDNFYRPDNLTVVICGKIDDQKHILQTLYEYELDYDEMHQNDLNPFKRPWSTVLPSFQHGIETTINFIPRNLNRKPNATVCFGWRGCPSIDIETTLALKILTAYVSVGPLWTKFITQTSQAERISWCLLEYVNTTSLITVHGIKSLKDIDNIVTELKSIFQESSKILDLNEIKLMIDRIYWHQIRELESDPSLILASCITKAELYGNGDREQLEKRLNSTNLYHELCDKPVDYWLELISNYFLKYGIFVTKIVPRSFYTNEQELPIPEQPTTAFQSELPNEHSFIETSKRASSRPRSKSNNLSMNNLFQEEEVAERAAEIEKSSTTEEIGHIEKLLKEEPKPFPLCESQADSTDFSERLRTTTIFLDQISECSIRNYELKNYSTNDETQHAKFPINNLPFYTFLVDTKCSFVYLTTILDTTHLTCQERKFISIITSLIGAIICPRPPGLDTDTEIQSKNEFNPPQFISDSQVSLGSNGEMMQNIFITLIVRQEYYEWSIGMLHYLLYKFEFTTNFIKFVCEEATKGLAYNYRMQTAEKPNYEYFDSSEINLYSLIKLIYCKESNARLFVGRRRLDLINEFLQLLNTNPTQMVDEITNTWKKIVNHEHIIVQLGTDVDELVKKTDPIDPWKKYFGQKTFASDFNKIRPTLELQMLNSKNQLETGIVVTIKHPRPPCLTIGIPIDPTLDYFPALCVTLQLYSQAQKWIWSCLDEIDDSQPIFRMPCQFANICTLNLESSDIIGSLQILKIIVDENWEWLNSLLITTKLMIVNDPVAAVESGPQGSIIMNLLSNISNTPISIRRDLMKKCLQVNLEDVKEIIRNHLSNFFNPKYAWYSLMVEENEKSKLVERLGMEFGFQFHDEDLIELCTTL